VFRLTTRSAIELALALLLGLIGLTLLLGTIDEYKAGRAFDRAMDAYAAGDQEDLQEELDAAMAAKAGYDAPQEAHGRLLLDEAKENPVKCAEAKELFEALLARQEARSGQASLAVHLGRAVAELEAARAAGPEPKALGAALDQARSRLEAALSLYPDSGDLQVSLASIALLEGSVPRCESHLAKIAEKGDISIDALPFLYNLNGLVALRKNQFPEAAAEFEKVREFAPHWDVPFLNLCAAQAQGIIHTKTNPRVADGYANSIRKTLGSLKSSKSPLYAVVAEALAIYYIRRGDADSALNYLKEAEARGGLGPEGRFNRAVAHYLAARRAKRAPADRARLLGLARGELEGALKGSDEPGPTRFIAAATLGTIDTEEGQAESAVAHFKLAIEAAPKADDPFVAEVLPRIHLSLAALHCAAGRFVEAIPHLESAQGAGVEAEKVAALLTQLRTPPTIDDFSVKQEKMITDHDLSIGALLATPATAKPLAPENIELTLTDALSSGPRAVPFRLQGHRLYAAAINLPQGRYRVALRLTDALGNRTSATSQEFDVDREPPRVLDRDPAPGATVKSLESIRFRLADTIGSVDVKTLQVSLRYPAGAALSARLLVSRGKYLYASPDGATRRDQQATTDVQCPVPLPTPPGEYRVIVQAADTAGKAADTEWGFVLAP